MPRFRYDIEYKLDDGQSGPWCSLDKYRDLQRGEADLHPPVHWQTVTTFCEDAEPAVGESYKFRIRASHVWKKSGDTNVRNGPWKYSGAVVYNPSGDPPGTPVDVEATGGKDSLLVFWDVPSGGTRADYYLVQWRTRGDRPFNDELKVSDHLARSVLLKDMASYGRYQVRVIAGNVLGESAPSVGYSAMSGAPGAPTDLAISIRDTGGFTLTWDRPDPYYPNNPDFRPVRRSNKKAILKKAILDDDGNTVPQFRYDVEYKLPDGQSGGWCSLRKYRNLHRGYDTLDPAEHRVNLTSYCKNAEPVVGENYNFRIRASYVWHKSGDTNPRNGPWVYSGPAVYNPTSYSPAGR